MKTSKGDTEWGTALKPAHEPIVLARKPISEKSIADNVLKWGTGGINIDGCRIEMMQSIQIQIQILKMLVQSQKKQSVLIN